MKPHRDEYIRAIASLNNTLILLECQNSDFTNEHVSDAIESIEKAILVFESDVPA